MASNSACNSAGPSTSSAGIVSETVELVQQRLVTGKAPEKKKRQSHSREKKLKVVKFYHENHCNMYQTCKKFELNSKTVKRWVVDEEKIKNSKKASKRVKFSHAASYPQMEESLYEEYKELRRKGLKVSLLP